MRFYIKSCFECTEKSRNFQTIFCMLKILACVHAVPRRYFFCGSFVLFMSCLCHAFAPVIAAPWSPAGKGLTSWLLFVMFIVFFITFPCGILGQVWYLIYRFLIFAVFLTLFEQPAGQGIEKSKPPFPGGFTVG